MMKYPDDEDELEEQLEEQPAETCSRCGTLIIGETPVRAQENVLVGEVWVPVTELTLHWDCYIEAARNGEM